MTLHSQERVTAFEQNYTDDLLRRLKAQLIDEHPDGRCQAHQEWRR